MGSLLHLPALGRWLGFAGMGGLGNYFLGFFCCLVVLGKVWMVLVGQRVSGQGWYSLWDEGEDALCLGKGIWEGESMDGVEELLWSAKPV